MIQKWRERPRANRWASIGAIGGAVVAGVIAFIFAFEESTFVRYLIMTAGLLIGGGIGLLAAQQADRR